MTLEQTPLKDCFVITPKIFGDERGYFYEVFHSEKFEKETGIKMDVVQENQSLSKIGVIRGLHLQLGNYAQAKLIRVLEGEILDVVVDVRKDSPTFGKSHSVVISKENHKQIYIPRGFLHGFAVTSDEAVINYKCDNFYSLENEAGVIFNDSDLAIDWPVFQNSIVSEKDSKLLNYKDFLDIVI